MNKRYFLKSEICKIQEIMIKLNSLKSSKTLLFLPLSKLSLDISINVTRPLRSILEQFTILPQLLHLSSTCDLRSKSNFKTKKKQNDFIFIVISIILFYSVLGSIKIYFENTLTY